MGLEGGQDHQRVASQECRTQQFCYCRHGLRGLVCCGLCTGCPITRYGQWSPSGEHLWTLGWPKSPASVSAQAGPFPGIGNPLPHQPPTRSVAPTLGWGEGVAPPNRKEVQRQHCSCSHLLCRYKLACLEAPDPKRPQMAGFASTPTLPTTQECEIAANKSLIQIRKRAAPSAWELVPACSGLFCLLAAPQVLSQPHSPLD